MLFFFFVLFSNFYGASVVPPFSEYFTDRFLRFFTRNCSERSDFKRADRLCRVEKIVVGFSSLFFFFFVQPIFAFAKPRSKEPPRDAEVSMPPIYFYFSLHFCTLQRSMLSPPRGATPRKRWRSHWEAMIHGALGFFFDFCRQKFILTGFSPFLWSYLD